MSRHGRGESLTDLEQEWLVAFAEALQAVGVRTIDLGPSAAEAFDIILFLWRTRAEERGNQDVRFYDGQALAENVLIFTSCALRIATWTDDMMDFGHHTPANNRRWLKRHCAVDADWMIEIAEALCAEYPHLVTRKARPRCFDRALGALAQCPHHDGARGFCRDPLRYGLPQDTPCVELAGYSS